MDLDDMDDGSDYEQYPNGQRADDEEEEEEEGQMDDEDGDADADEGEEDDEADEDDEEDDDDDDDDDEDEDDDDDDDDASDTSEGSDPSEGGMDIDTPAPRSNSPTSYLRKTQARLAAIHPSHTSLHAKSYAIEPLAALPHSAHVHAMALSGDGSVLLTGGSDGHVRRYDVYGTMNGRNMLTLGVRHAYVEGITRGGVLHSWWGNEERNAVRDRRRSSSNSDEDSDDEDDDDEEHRPVSAVHSLAIQRDALWSLSGTASGAINLTTLRHDPGVTQHVLRKHRGPVSALALGGEAESELVSGGWDGGLHQWDLNTGQVVRSYAGCAGQVSGVGFRPASGAGPQGRRGSSAVAITMRRSEGAGDGAGEDKDMAPQAGPSTPAKRRRSTPRARSTSKPPEPKPESNGDGSADASSLAQPSASAIAPASASASAATAAAPSAAAPSNPVPSGPAPSSEDLAFEAELQASLGLDASGAGQGGEDELPDLKPAQGESKLKENGGSSSSQRGSTAEDRDGEGDADSLFGGASEEDAEEDAEAEADSEADADADGDAEDDADGDDDQPLARTTRPDGVATPSAGGINLPGIGTGSSASATALPLPLPTAASTQPGPGANANANANAGASKLKPPPGLTDTLDFKGDYSTFSQDVFMATTLSGQVMLYDRRVPTPSEPSPSRGVLALPLPARTPPWCSAAIWAPDGDRIYVARRNETVEEWDARLLRGGGDEVDRSLSWSGQRRSSPLHTRTLRLPTSSGPVTALRFMPNGRHLVCASTDNVRLWDLDKTPGESGGGGGGGGGGSGGAGGIPFRIVAGHHGGAISSLLVDPTGRFLFSASGDRGWEGGSTECVLVGEISAHA